MSSLAAGESHEKGAPAPGYGHRPPTTARRYLSSLARGVRGRGAGQALGLFLLILVAVLQLRLLAESFILPRAIRMWEVRSLSALERSAFLSEGKDFMEFVVFLRQVIPETGKVVFPPHSYIAKAGAFTELGFMQYFMFPRSVLNCAEPVEDCVRGLTGARSYIVAIGGFPPASVAKEVKDFIPFRGDRGVYVPR